MTQSNDMTNNIMPTALVDDSVVDYIKRAEQNGINPLELFVSQSITKTSMMMSDKDAFYDVLKHFFGVYVRTKRSALTPPQSPNLAVLDALDKWDNQGEINHEELCLFIECTREHLKHQKGR